MVVLVMVGEEEGQRHRQTPAHTQKIEEAKATTAAAAVALRAMPPLLFPLPPPPTPHTHTQTQTQTIPPPPLPPPPSTPKTSPLASWPVGQAEATKDGSPLVFLRNRRA